tara:strand:+ start:1140 stop:1490 length:351 start_codon:yes stop_codon:yes gene_type:complete
MKALIVLLLTSVMAMSQTEVTKIITGKAVVMPIGTKASEWNKDYVKITAKISNNLPKNVIFRHYIDVQKHGSVQVVSMPKRTVFVRGVEVKETVRWEVYYPKGTTLLIKRSNGDDV